MHGGFQGGPPGPMGPGGGGYGAGPPPGTPPPGYGPPAPMAAPPVYADFGSYEFNPLESSILARTAARAKQWGIISAVLGAVQMTSSCGMVASLELGVLLPMGIVAVIVGVTFIGVGNSLDAAVRTQGNDVPHLMAAMQKLGNAFTVQILCNILGVVAFVLAMVAVFVLAVAGAAGG